MIEAVKKIKNNRGYVILFFIVMAIACAFSFMCLIHTSSKASQRAGLEMDTLYLKELTTQTIGHFQTGISSHFSQLRTSAASIKEEDLINEDTLAAYFKRIQEYNNFNFFALVDEEGRYYCVEGVFPAASKIRFLGLLLEGQKDLISYNETILGEDMILLGEPIEPVYFRGKKMVAVLAGMDINVLNDQLALKREDAKTYSSMIESSGKYIVNNSYNSELFQSTNVLSKLEKYAVFLPGYSLEEVREDLKKGEAGLAAYSVEGQNQYMYYAPIQGTDWYLLTIIPYEVVNSIINVLISSLNRNVFIMMIFILGLLSCLFLFFYTHMNKDEKKLRIAKEAAQKARIKAENANRAKSEFLSRMSHEIRTPMNGIIGMGTIARQNLDNPAKVEECLKKQALSSQHLLDLINDVLDMSKIESGRIELRNSPFNFRAALEGLVNIYYAQARTKGIEFETILAGKIYERLMGDSLRLNQIISNLLSNAMKFTPPGGSVCLKVVCVDEKEDEVVLRFEVSDSGCGIAEENYEKIFESFEQENSDVTSVYGGTGLGLAIVKRFAELMGGRVWIRSQLGSGSTFFVELPIRKTGEQPEIPEFSDMKVLVIDDNKENGDYASALLERVHARANWVNNGLDAISVAEAAYRKGEGYDICLIDWKMPGINGVETAIRIRERLGEAAPVLMLTAYDETEVEGDVSRAGIAYIITKPLFLSTIAEGFSAFGKAQPVPDALHCPSVFDFQGQHILLAEDNEINSEIACELLAATGAVTATARNGEEAVSLFEKSSPGDFALILMDVQMPVMDGYEATRRIRGLNREDAKSIPIFAMTANAFAEDEEKSRLAGMDSHITKPLDVKILYSQINLFLTKRSKNTL